MNHTEVPHQDGQGTGITVLGELTEAPVVPVADRPDPGSGTRVSAASLYLATLAPGSRPAMRRSLEVIADVISGGRCGPEQIPWGSMTYRNAVALRFALVEAGFAPATVNKTLAAWRGTLRCAFRSGEMSADELARASDIRQVPGTAQRRGRALGLDEIEGVFACCDEDARPCGARDGAILAVLFGCGLRRAEAVGLDVDEIDLGRRSVSVTGKRGKFRTVPLHPNVAARLQRWLSIRGHAPGPLFVGITRYGTLRSGRLTTGSVRSIVLRRAGEAGQAPASPHDYRRTAVTQWLDEGVDIALVATLVGHATVDTTRLYDRRGDEQKAAAVERLKVPGQAVTAA